MIQYPTENGGMLLVGGSVPGGVGVATIRRMPVFAWPRPTTHAYIPFAKRICFDTRYASTAT